MLLRLASFVENEYARLLATTNGEDATNLYSPLKVSMPTSPQSPDR